MGKIAEALRSNLRELAQADARLLRELDEALPADGLEALNTTELKARCRQRGLKGYSTLRKDGLIARLRAAAAGSGTPPAAPLVAPGRPAKNPAAKPSSDLASLEARLDRMEALLLRIAAQLGVG
jgi:hypothetical protein